MEVPGSSYHLQTVSRFLRAVGTLAFEYAILFSFFFYSGGTTVSEGVLSKVVGGVRKWPSLLDVPSRADDWKLVQILNTQVVDFYICFHKSERERLQARRRIHVQFFHISQSSQWCNFLIMITWFTRL